MSNTWRKADGSWGSAEEVERETERLRAEADALALLETQKAVDALKMQKIKSYAIYGGVAAGLLGLGFLGYKMLAKPKKKVRRRRKR